MTKIEVEKTVLDINNKLLDIEHELIDLAHDKLTKDAAAIAVKSAHKILFVRSDLNNLIILYK